MASRVVWWKSPDEVLADEDDFLCRVMARGTLADVNTVQAHFGVERLQRALETARPGSIDPRSWHYWHRRLGLGPAGPLPTRTFK